MKAKKERPTCNRARLEKSIASPILWQNGEEVKSESRTPAPEPLESYTPEEIKGLAREALQEYHREYQRVNRDKCERYRMKSALKARYGIEKAEWLMAEYDRGIAKRRQAGILPDQEKARTLPPCPGKP